MVFDKLGPSLSIGIILFLSSFTAVNCSGFDVSLSGFTCYSLQQALLERYDFDIVCACGGILISHEELGGTVPLGKYHMNCMSENFFSSPDDKVWWHLKWQFDFDDTGLIKSSQTVKYVKGRYIRGYKPVYESFVLNYESGNCSIDNCDTCVKTAGCYSADGCYNPNTFEDFLVADTCSLPAVTDFATGDLAASIGYLQDDVKHVYYGGGATCISPIYKTWYKFSRSYDCTCEPYYLPDLDEDEAAVLVSCRLPCVYGPETGEVEWIEYLDIVYKHSSTNPLVMDEAGSEVWSESRYEYIKGRSDVETFRRTARYKGGNINILDWCSVTRTDGIECDCSYSNWLHSDLKLDCSDGQILDYEGDDWNELDGKHAGGPWETMLFAARWKEGSTCLRPVDSTPAPTGPTPAPAPVVITSSPTSSPTPRPPHPSYIMYTTGGCESRNELGSSFVDSVEECAAKCDALADCVSFEYSNCDISNNSCKCQLSSSCSSYEMTVMDTTGSDSFNWFLKVTDDTIVCDPGFMLNRAMFNTACTDANELGNTIESTLRDCSVLCDSTLGCISFEFNHVWGTCNLSSSCTESGLDVDEDGNFQIRTDGFSYYGKFLGADCAKTPTEAPLVVTVAPTTTMGAPTGGPTSDSAVLAPTISPQSISSDTNVSEPPESGDETIDTAASINDQVSSADNGTPFNYFTFGLFVAGHVVLAFY